MPTRPRRARSWPSHGGGIWDERRPGNVAAFRADPRSQQQGRQFPALAFGYHIGDLRAEYAASGVADDVVEKALRSDEGAVLVVDDGVGVVAIRGDEPRRRSSCRLRSRAATPDQGPGRCGAECADLRDCTRKSRGWTSKPASRKASRGARGVISSCDSMRST